VIAVRSWLCLDIIQAGRRHQRWANFGRHPPYAQSEDCLTLSVWTPAPETALRAVFVWVHGGAFNHGSGAWPCYSGDVLVRRGDIVVVVINYRLGALGYLQLPGDDGKAVAPANRGLLDQMKALRWVQENFGAFGAASPSNFQS